MNLLKSAVLCLAILGLMGCSSKKSEPEAAEIKGSSSGGGGFVDENSTRILNMAATGLAKMIRISSPGIYADLPQGITQDEFANIIQNVRYEPNSDRTREGRSLMFDYGTDKGGRYIVALKPFFIAYSSYPIKFATGESVQNLMLDVRLKLAHEAAHHLGLGVRNETDGEAEEFGLNLQSSLESDMIHCQTDDVGNWPFHKKVSANTTAKRFDWIWHRPTGVGLFMSTDTWACCEGAYGKPEDIAKDYSDEVALLYGGGLVKRHYQKIQTGERESGKQLDRDFARHVCDTEPSLVEGRALTLSAVYPDAESALFERILLQNQNSAPSFKGEFVYSLKDAPSREQRFPLSCESRFERLKMPARK